MKTAHLEGREFVYGETDCYDAVRCFYQDNFGLNLPNYARPNEFWTANMNMYLDRFYKNGFRVLDVHPSEYQPADLVIMAIKSPLGNHAGVLLESGQLFHHMYGRLSTVEPYSGLWRNTTVAILRHKDIVYQPDESPVSYMELISPQRKQKIENALSLL